MAQRGDRVILRGERILILKDLKGSVLAAEHQGHLDREAMVRQLRRSLCWPDFEQDVKQYLECCLGCLATLVMTE